LQNIAEFLNRGLLNVKHLISSTRVCRAVHSLHSSSSVPDPPGLRYYQVLYRVAAIFPDQFQSFTNTLKNRIFIQGADDKLGQFLSQDI
jgi:hypothetical protein